MDFSIGEHSIIFKKALDPFDLGMLPEETSAAFLAAMKRFPLGKLSYLSVGDLTTPTLFFDHRRAAFFACSIDQILDLHAKHLNARWQRERKAKIRQLYWQHRSLRRQAA